MSFATYIYSSVALVVWSFVFGSTHFLPSKYCSTLLRTHHSLPKVYEKNIPILIHPFTLPISGSNIDLSSFL